MCVCWRCNVCVCICVSCTHEGCMRWSHTRCARVCALLPRKCSYTFFSRLVHSLVVCVGVEFGRSTLILLPTTPIKQVRSTVACVFRRQRLLLLTCPQLPVTGTSARAASYTPKRPQRAKLLQFKTATQAQFTPTTSRLLLPLPLWPNRQ